MADPVAYLKQHNYIDGGSYQTAAGTTMGCGDYCFGLSSADPLLATQKANGAQVDSRTINNTRGLLDTTDMRTSGGGC